MKAQRYTLLAAAVLVLLSLACSSVAGFFGAPSATPAVTGTPAIDSGHDTSAGGQPESDPAQDSPAADPPADDPPPAQAGIDQCLLGTWSLDLEVFLENMREYATGMPGEIADARGQHLLEFRAGGTAVNNMDLTIILCAPTGDCGPIDWTSSGEGAYSIDPQAGIIEGEGGAMVLATVLQAAESESMTTVESMHYTCQGDTLTLQAEDAPASVFHRVE